MLMMAYALINSELGKEDEALEKLRTLPEVKEAHIVYGIYDIIAKLEAESLQVLKDMLISKIWNMDEVKSCSTLMFSE
jgi:DNA-binding Lrp family transcriptional regulator